MPVEIKKLGSIYMEGDPVIPGTAFKYDGAEISLGNTIPGKELEWIEWNGLLVANRCACVAVSWQGLDKHGCIFGWPVYIDGKSYLCRSLEVGSLSRSMNEWDSILDDLGDDDSIWHWKEQWFWGQEQAVAWTHRYVRGYTSARYRCDRPERVVSDSIGFRPVLKKLSSAPLDKNVGKQIVVYGPHKVAIEGRLVGFDDYDIALDGVAPLHADCDWAIRTPGGQAVVRRNSSIIQIA